MISGVPCMVIVNFNKCLSYFIRVFGFEWAKMQVSTEYVNHRQNVFIGFIFYCDGYATHVYQINLISSLHSFNSNWFQWSLKTWVLIAAVPSFYLRRYEWVFLLFLINFFHVLFKLSCAFSLTLHQALNLWFLENDFSCWTFNNFFLPLSICRILNLLYFVPPTSKPFVHFLA